MNDEFLGILYSSNWEKIVNKRILKNWSDFIRNKFLDLKYTCICTYREYQQERFIQMAYDL